MATRLRFAAIGLDHRHIYHQVGRLLELGCECVGYWTEGEPQTLAGFLRRFPDLTRFENADRLYEDPTIHLVVTAAIPDLRSGIAVRAMRHGMDVMVDKPGVVSLAQLREVERVQTETGRIWSVNYSERFEVRAMTRVNELIQAGAIGEVVHLTGFGPHRINRHLRPPWFFERARTGGILCDIASHQIDQFLHLTGAPDADVVAAAVANRTNPDYPGFEDYGEVLLRTERSTGFSRVDWYTPDGLPTWGDGRLTVVGTGGYIDLRKYVDIAGAPGTDHLFLVDNDGMRRVECSNAPLPYYEALVRDVHERTATAMSQRHCFKVMELALRAQAVARRMQ
ncbi:MAG: Gfo/Idh/MocA family oxidoreductase [Rhodospirillales bacterium]|nr:Gfo/Idh/MocA family oxidoreductase [Rhodospirillales bacterium]MCY4097394.1 Gfo/Idh/MocA family oxidoreductase [Rhodospirillales bacterium]